MDKKVFLLDKTNYSQEQIENLSEKDLEEWVAEDDYEDDYSIIKIDANGYDTADDAIKREGILFPEEYYIISFGF